MRDSDDQDSVSELHTNVAGVAVDEDVGAYYHGDFGDSNIENDAGKQNTNVVGIGDEQDKGAYLHRAFRDSAGKDNVGELKIGNAGVADNHDAGVADDNDTGVYHRGAFREYSHKDNIDKLSIEDARVFRYGAAGDECQLGELNDENAKVYKHRAFLNSGDEQPATDTAGIVDNRMDTELYHHRAIRDASFQLHVGEFGVVTGVEEDKEMTTST